MKRYDFRIIKEGNQFYIDRKYNTYFGEKWKEETATYVNKSEQYLTQDEGRTKTIYTNYSKRLSFNTFDEAEEWIIKQYEIRDKELKIKNEYIAKREIIKEYKDNKYEKDSGD